MRHPFTRRNNAVATAVFALIGVAAAWLVKDARVGTYIFLTVTTVQAWSFTLFYGFASTWRSTAAARALFYVVFAYALLSTDILVGYWYTVSSQTRPGWLDTQRQFLYLGLALAGFNLTMTTFRLVLDGRRSTRRAP